MAYGLQVKNSDGQIILDSSEGFSTFIKVASGAATPSSNLFDFPSGITTSHLFFVRIPGSGVVSENFYAGSGDRQVYTTYASAAQWLRADKTTSNASGFDTGYGLNVFDGTGVAEADLLFTTTTGTALDIVAVGTYDSLLTSSFTSIRYTIDSQEPHYVLVNGSMYISINIPFVGQLVAQNGYEFSYTGSTLDYIDVISKVVLPGTTTPIGGGASYMILKERS